MERKARFPFLLISLLLLVSSGNLYAERGLGGLTSASQLNHASGRLGNFKALVIGIGDYRDPKISDLKTAVKDAREVANVLRDKYGFQVDLLLNRKATRKMIYNALRKLAADSTEADSVLIYYAGHGELDRVYHDGWWVPADARGGEPLTYLDNTQVQKAMRNMKARHVLLISDSCYSGTLFGQFRSLPTVITEKYYLNMYNEKSRWGMTSGNKEPVSDRGTGGHSIFAYQLLKVLNRNERPYLSTQEIYTKIAPIVGNNSEQTPLCKPIRNTGDQGGEFIFVALNSSQKTVTDIPVSEPIFKIIKPKPRPSASGFSLGDLEAEADRIEAVKLAWRRKLSEMKLSLNKVKAFEKRDIPSDRKALAWRKFAQAFEEDNPESYEDEELRREAQSRITYWEAYHEPKPGETWKEPVTGMEFAWIPAGSFMMGSNNGGSNEKPVHRVTLTKGFYMQTTEVTQGQWRAVMGSNPSRFSNCGDDCPVEKVSWNNVQEFFERLNQQNLDSEYKFSLPTEAQWEYAARAGSTTRYYFGDSGSQLGEYAWYLSNSNGKTHPAARKKPNAWGLYDMHGNVWEWCRDWKGGYPSSDINDPEGPGSGTYKVLRGGSWIDAQEDARCASRDLHSPNARYDLIGFRCARTLK